MVLPRFVERALRGQDVDVHGAGTQTRCFCHVDDVVEALTGLMDSGRCFGEVYNVGSTEEISIRALAERVIARTKSASKIVEVPYQNVYGAGFEDMQRRVPSIAKIDKATGWKPKRNLDQIIDDIAAWIRTDTGGAIIE
jgi:UDP-glucose 4-epimerase